MLLRFMFCLLQYDSFLVSLISYFQDCDILRTFAKLSPLQMTVNAVRRVPLLCPCPKSGSRSTTFGIGDLTSSCMEGNPTSVFPHYHSTGFP